MSLKKETKFWLIKHFLTFPTYYIINLFARTIKVTYQNHEAITDLLNEGGRVVIASWHQRFFGGFYIPKILRRPISIMISQSRDGDFIAGVVERIGWVPVRGSGSRGGKEALRTLVDDMRGNGLTGHIVDGPTGPPRVIKPGLISLAHLAGAAICPAFVFYERPWVFNSWDRFMVPKPFSRVVLRFGSLIFLPGAMDSERFESYRQQVEQVMRDGYENDDPFVNGGNSIQRFAL